MRFSRLEYCSGLPFSSPGDLPNPGSDPRLLHWQVDLYHWATREARVLGRAWTMLSASFNMVEAFSQFYSLSLPLSLSHAHTVSHDTSTLENVLFQWPLCLAFLGHKGHCTDTFIWTYLYVLLLSLWIPYFSYEFLISHSRIQWKHAWQYCFFSLLCRGVFRNLKIF